MMKKGCTEM